MKSLDTVFEEDADGFNGNFEGYTTTRNEENQFNFLKNWGLSEDGLHDYTAMLSPDSVTLVIKNINVEESFRGMGFGKQILLDLFDSTGADIAVLMVDENETQLEGQDLHRFYSSLGFKTLEGDFMVRVSH